MNTARSREARNVDVPRVEAYPGRKKAGTRRGKVPIAQPRKRRANFQSAKRRLYARKLSVSAKHEVICKLTARGLAKHDAYARAEA